MSGNILQELRVYITASIICIICLLTMLMISTYETNKQNIFLSHNNLVNTNNELYEKFNFIVEELNKLKYNYSNLVTTNDKLYKNHKDLAERFNFIIEEHNKLKNNCTTAYIDHNPNFSLTNTAIYVFDMVLGLVFIGYIICSSKQTPIKEQPIRPGDRIPKKGILKYE